jgi:hypothetical protein
VFASWIPEITELAAQRNKYGGKYNKDVRKRYTGKKKMYQMIESFLLLITFSFDHSDFMISLLLLTYTLFIMQMNETNKVCS